MKHTRIAVGLAVIGLGLGAVAIVGPHASPDDAGDARAVEEVLASTSTTSTAAPTTSLGEALVVDGARWTVNERSLLADLTPIPGRGPTALRIDALGIDAPVGAYGVDSVGRMDVPDNVTDVGWYKHGPAPGDPGSAVLAAHVDLAGPGRGLFFDLDELQPGELVVVSYSDATEQQFRVVARSTYLKTELPLDTIFSRSGKPVLTLVTCGGGFSRSARSYDSNVVVYAEPFETTDTTPTAS